MIGDTVSVSCVNLAMCHLSPRDFNRAQTRFNVILDFGKQLWKQAIAADFHFEFLAWFEAQSCFSLDNLPKGTEPDPWYDPPWFPSAAAFCWPRMQHLISVAMMHSCPGPADINHIFTTSLLCVLLPTSVRLITRRGRCGSVSRIGTLNCISKIPYFPRDFWS